jgi:Tol biopolymer transport system component
VRPDGSGVHRLGSGHEAVASPDGKRVAFVVEPINCPRCPDTYLVPIRAGDVRKIRDHAESPAWGPHGKRIAYVDGGAIGGLASTGGDIYLMRADGSHSSPLAVGRGNDEEPAWSPDGSRLAYSRSGIDGSVNEIVVVNADGTKRRVIARHGPLFAGNPAWSTKNRIAYSAYLLRKRTGIVAVTDPTGSRKRVLFSRHGREFHGLGWSPDGSRLIVDEMRWSHHGHEPEREYGLIWVVGTRGRHRLTSGHFDDRDPVWSPDGRFVAFTRRSGDRSHVMIVRSSGGGLRRVPIGSRSAYLDSWTR